MRLKRSENLMKGEHINKNSQIVESPPGWLKDLKKRIMKGFGKRCSEFCYGCGVCMAWLAYDCLNDLFGWKFVDEIKQERKEGENEQN